MKKKTVKTELPRTKAQKIIIGLLTLHKSLSFMQIQKELPLNRSTLTKHLTALKQNGVIVAEKRGKEQHYKISGKKKIPFDKQLELLGSEYIAKLIHRNKNYRFGKNNAFRDRQKEVSDRFISFFIYLLIQSMNTGKNYLNAFDINDMAYQTLHLILKDIFSMPKLEPIMHSALNDGLDDFFKLVHDLAQKKECKKELMEFMDLYTENMSFFTQSIDLESIFELKVSDIE